MSLGETIRRYRKLKDMTQQEMAGRLGVTASAVNKWEHDKSCPDIALLAPIARSLDISLDTLLSFHKDPTPEEIGAIVQEMAAMLKEKPYDEALCWAEKKLAQYPDCAQLIVYIAILLEVQAPDIAAYDSYLGPLYARVLDSDDGSMRAMAAERLISSYMRKKEYDKAESFLSYLSVQDPQRKRIQAQICAETGRIQEAYKMYEELLYSGYQQADLVLHGIYSLALQEDDLERARHIVQKQMELARCFEMGAYHEAACGLELATLEKDADAVLASAEKLLNSMGRQTADLRNAPLYGHMDFQELSEEFLAERREELLQCLRDEESYASMKDDERWQALTAQ